MYRLVYTSRNLHSFTVSTTSVSWVIMPCTSVKRNRRFGEVSCLHLQRNPRPISWTQKNEYCIREGYDIKNERTSEPMEVVPKVNAAGKRGRQREASLYPGKREATWIGNCVGPYPVWGRKKNLALAGIRKFPRSMYSVKEIFRLIINQRVFEVVTVYFETHGNTTSVSPEVTP